MNDVSIKCKKERMGFAKSVETQCRKEMQINEREEKCSSVKVA